VVRTTGTSAATPSMEAMAQLACATYSIAHVMGATACPHAKHTRLAPAIRAWHILPATSPNALCTLSI